jgi:4'-phosphopantetheinyl transferase EntD
VPLHHEGVRRTDLGSPFGRGDRAPADCAPVIEAILPPNVIAVDTQDSGLTTELFESERAVIARAVDQRRREFTAARACARQALTRLGRPRTPLRSGGRNEPPLWPEGVVGSITHCDGYCACAVGLSTEFAAIGIDAEPNRELSPEVLAAIAHPREQRWVIDLGQRIPTIHWDHLLFSAKEAAYKAWYPLTRRKLTFTDALVELGPSPGTFSAQLLGRAVGHSSGWSTVLTGRWTVVEGLLLTAVALGSPARATEQRTQEAASLISPSQ